MSRRGSLWLTGTILGATVATITGLVPGSPRLVYNASPSVPLGFYVVSQPKALLRGDLVLARTPLSVRDLADRRHYLPRTVPLVKHVAAMKGDTVCAAGRMIFINGAWQAERRTRDSLGRALPVWYGCRTLRSEDVFLLNPDVADSFDGRYFGVTDRAAVIGALRPI